MLTEARSFRLEPYFRLSDERDERFTYVCIVTFCPRFVKVKRYGLLRIREIAHSPHKTRLKGQEKPGNSGEKYARLQINSFFDCISYAWRHSSPSVLSLPDLD